MRWWCVVVVLPLGVQEEQLKARVTQVKQQLGSKISKINAAVQQLHIEKSQLEGELKAKTEQVRHKAQPAGVIHSYTDDDNVVAVGSKRGRGGGLPARLRSAEVCLSVWDVVSQVASLQATVVEREDLLTKTDAEVS